MTLTKDSIYELINAPTNVMKQHFVENFSGETLDTFRWGFGNQDSSTNNLASMSDEINGGIKLETGSSVDNQAFYMSFMTGSSLTGSDNSTWHMAIPFMPFRSGEAHMIFTLKLNANVTTMGNQYGGFSETAQGDATAYNAAGMQCNKTNTKFRFHTTNSGGSGGYLDSDVATDNSFHTYYLEADITADPTQSGGYSRLSIDGVLKGTKTTAIGYFSEKVAPIFSTQRSNTSGSGVTSSMNINYVEAWNQ